MANVCCAWQVHYLQERPAGDQSGIRLRMTSKSTPFSAGMINYASYFTIPPGKPKHPIENQCCYSGFEILKGFAFRVHTHALGRSVSLTIYVFSLTQPLFLTQSLFLVIQTKTCVAAHKRHA